MRRAVWLPLLAIAMLGCVMGCGGPKMGTVTGKVTVHGKPIPRGILSFVPVQGAPHPAAIVDGKYDTGEIPVGEYRLTVTINMVPGAPTTKANASQQTNIGAGLGAADAAPPPKKTAAAPAQVDGKYSSADTSGLKFTVDPGANTFDVPDLK